MYAEQWARPAVQWGGVQWDASLEMAIAESAAESAEAPVVAPLGMSGGDRGWPVGRWRD